MSGFFINSLPVTDSRLVYPLVREAEPAVELTTWLAYARRAVKPGPGGRTGIMVATRDGHRFPCGLFCYRCTEDLAFGSIVTADTFVAVDILDPRPVVRVMVDALEALGVRLGCNAVRSVVHSRSDVLSGCLEACGHQMDTRNFIKRVPEFMMAVGA